MGKNKVGGYLVQFTTEDDPDLEGEFFTKATDFGQHLTAPVLYQHGMDTKIGRRRLGSGTLKPDDVGVWIEAQLELRDEYEQAIYEMAVAGKLGWSSGTAPHLVEREGTGKAVHLISWPLGLDASLTPTPAEPRTRAVTLKSVYPDPEDKAPEADSAPAAGESVVSDIQRLTLEIDILEVEYGY